MADLNRSPFFSVGIPAWKSNYLTDAIQSVLNQSFSDFELIIVNDASPYGLDEIVGSFDDGRIRYYDNHKNFGAEAVVDNWNKCLSYSCGKYFLLLGDDDRLEPDCLEAFAELIKSYPDLDVYHCRANILNENSIITGYTASWPEYETVYNNIWHRINGWRQQYLSDFVYKTDKLKANGGYYKLPMGWTCDDITSYIAMSEKGIAHTEKRVFSYRQSDITMSSSGDVFLKLVAIAGEKKWLEDYLKNEPDNSDDLVLYRKIKEFLPDYSRKKIIGTLALWASWSDFFKFGRFSRLGISKKDIFIAILLKCKFAII